MKLQRYNVSDDYYRNGFSEDDRGDWCMSVHVDALEVENEFLRAELERLKAPPKKLRAEEVTEPGVYWWNWKESGRWVIVVARYDNSRIVIKTFLGDEIFIGRFIGPLEAPEWDGALL